MTECWEPVNNRVIYVYRGQEVFKVLPTFAQGPTGPFFCYCPLEYIDFSIPVSNFISVNKASAWIRPSLT